MAPSVSSRASSRARPPLEIELAIGKVDTDAPARAFLNAPWELLAANGEHWALREDIVLVPVRRIGKASPPPAPSPNRLALVFMAAAPRGADNLSYEAEEATILDATKGLGLDLVVEESGTLDLLSAIVAREKPDVVQLSCHGALEPEPALLLEDDLGDPAVTPAKELVRKLAGHPPRMLFLSACETAEAHPVLDSLAPALVRAGVPSVLGWAAPVLDNEASIFAAALQRHLASGEDLARSLAYARLELASSSRLPERDESPIRSHDWHLARVYLGTAGGGALATAGGPRKHIDRGRALKTFLDAKGQRVPVASEAEFVGRRRPIQTHLRELRAGRGRPPALAVLIRGVGRQGKSSLAARVAQRLERTHDVVVLFERYDGAAVISALRERIGRPAIGEWVDRHLPRVEEDPRHLREALAELLEGPCAQLREAREDDTLPRSPCCWWWTTSSKRWKGTPMGCTPCERS
ncbi:MAG: CHAT domain-containing protein [bacterium]